MLREEVSDEEILACSQRRIDVVKIFHLVCFIPAWTPPLKLERNDVFVGIKSYVYISEMSGMLTGAIMYTFRFPNTWTPVGFIPHTESVHV